MESRRGLALTLMLGLVAIAFVIYESAPAKGARHKYNGWLMLGVLVLAGLCATWSLFDPQIQRWHANWRGSPFPIANAEVQQGSVVLTLRQLGRLHDQVRCHIVLPNKRPVTHDATV